MSGYSSNKIRYETVVREDHFIEQHRGEWALIEANFEPRFFPTAGSALRSRRTDDAFIVCVGFEEDKEVLIW